MKTFVVVLPIAQVSICDSYKSRPKFQQIRLIPIQNEEHSRLFKNIAKGTTDPRIEFISQDHSSQILDILQFQNLHKALTSKSQTSASPLREVIK